MSKVTVCVIVCLTLISSSNGQRYSPVGAVDVTNAPLVRTLAPSPLVCLLKQKSMSLVCQNSLTSECVGGDISLTQETEDPSAQWSCYASKGMSASFAGMYWRAIYIYIGIELYLCRTYLKGPRTSYY